MFWIVAAISLNLVSAESGQDAVGDFWLQACGLTEAETPTEAQITCVDRVTTSALDPERKFLELGDLHFAARHGMYVCTHCASTLPAVWPENEAGEQIRSAGGVVTIEVTYDIVKDGRTANLRPRLIEPLREDFHDSAAFEAAAIYAVERWRFYDTAAIANQHTRFTFDPCLDC